MIWELLLIFLLILLNSFFVMAELAVVSSRRARVQTLVDEGYSGAVATLELMDKPSRFLSTVQIGITLTTILTGAFGSATLVEDCAAWLSAQPHLPQLAAYAQEIAFALVVGGISFLSLVLGELVPKRVALNYPERIAAALARPMQILSTATAPLGVLLGASTEGLMRLLRLPLTTEHSVTEEEVKNLLAEGTETGVFEVAEQQMIEGVLRLSDRTVRSIMTPRPDVMWLDLDDPEEKIRQDLHECSHTRFPVCRGDLDGVVGVVQAKHLLDRALKNLPLDLETGLSKPLVVHDGTPVLRLLELFKQESQHMAVVVDEYGTVEGIVSVTDILESIAGELPEVGDASEPGIEVREDGSWLVDGMMDIGDIERRLGLRGLQGEGDFHTIAGFVLSRFGHVPKASEYVEWQNIRFEVMDMDGRRIDKLLIQKLGERGE